MACQSDFHNVAQRSNPKASLFPVPTGKKLAEPFNRLKNRANLFRRKNYSSQINISSRSSANADHIVPSDRPLLTGKKQNAEVILLKRSNSMICPQQRLQTLLNQTRSTHHRNSICLELAGCSTDESSTDDYQLTKSSLTHYLHKQLLPTMSHIDENESIPSANILTESTEPTDDLSKDNAFLLLNDDNNNEQDNHHSEQGSDVDVLPSSSSSSTMDTHHRREEREEPTEQIPILTNGASMISSSHLSSSSSPSSVTLRDHAEVIRIRRQCHSSISLLQHQQRHQQHQMSTSLFEEPFFDSKQLISTDKPHCHTEMSASKISTFTMTGKSLNNLDACTTNTPCEEKAVQTASNDSNNQVPPSIKRTISTASLSSSSALSMQTDSQEKKSNSTHETKTSSQQTHSSDVPHKWPHFHHRLLGEQNCTYWVNYLGSTAIKMSDDGLTAMPSQAIARLKQSTQYARVLPIIGLNISSRGVEFLKHTKDRVVICFHDIKTIHCACQDQDLRYFAYVTREQRLTHGASSNSTTASSSFDGKSHSPPSPSLSFTADYHHYCHVFVVKSEAMSTEIMLTFGQVFDLAYRLHRRLKSNGKKCKDLHSMINTNDSSPKLEVIRLSSKSDIETHQNSVMSSSAHSPVSSSSSSSIDDRKIFV